MKGAMIALLVLALVVVIGVSAGIIFIDRDDGNIKVNVDREKLREETKDVRENARQATDKIRETGDELLNDTGEAMQDLGAKLDDKVETPEETEPVSQ